MAPLSRDKSMKKKKCLQNNTYGCDGFVQSSRRQTTQSLLSSRQWSQEVDCCRRWENCTKKTGSSEKIAFGPAGVLCARIDGRKSHCETREFSAAAAAEAKATKPATRKTRKTFVAIIINYNVNAEYNYY